MSYVKTQIYGGSFQGPDGQLLSNGWIILRLSHDSNILLPASQVVSGYTAKVGLDSLGNVAGVKTVWTDDILNPSGSYYEVEAYSSAGLKVWNAPQYWILSSGQPINIGTIIPVNPL